MLPTYHPKLTERIISQTPRAVLGFSLITCLYVWVYKEFIPFSIMLTWVMLMFSSIALRYINSKILAKYIKHKNIHKTHLHTSFLLFIIIYSAILWSSSAILASAYSPTPYEYFSFMILMGIASSGALTLTPFFHIYMVFYAIIIFTAIGLLFYLGERTHTAAAILLSFSLPMYYGFSKSTFQDILLKIEMTTTLEKNIDALHHLSVTDSLTNTNNRRHFFQVSEKLIALAQRDDKPLSLLMIDIDYFKSINDTYGHQAGDKVLISLSDKISKMARKSDVFARVGGEEFALLLGNTSIAGAKSFADKLCKMIESEAFHYKDTVIKVTVSIGVAEMSKETINLNNLYSKADKNLYKAKKQGRNRAYV